MVQCKINLPAGKGYLYQSSIVAFVPLLAVELLLLMVHLWPFLDGHINAFYWLHEDWLEQTVYVIQVENMT